MRSDSRSERTCVSFLPVNSGKVRSGRALGPTTCSFEPLMASSSVAMIPAASGKRKRAMDVSVSDFPPKHSTPKKAARSFKPELEHAGGAISDSDIVSEASEARLVIDLSSNERQD